MTGPAYAAEAVRLANAFRFAEAAALVDEAFRCEDQLEVARGLLRHRPIYPNAQTAAAADVFFRAVYQACRTAFGEDSRPAMAAADNLASLLLGINKPAEAQPLREVQYRHLLSTTPEDDHSVLLARDNLALLYRRLGRDVEAAALYESVTLCVHLMPVHRALLESGRQVASCCRPWSANCHLWVYFDGVLDCETLMKDHATPECVTIHDHRGTHDGSERGLVCNVHHDAVMGRHPLL